MNSERTPSSDHPALDKRAQAAAWLARLRGPQRSAEVERGLQRWLRADAEHARAFELLTARLELAERLRGRPLPRRWRGRRNVSRSRWSVPVVGGMAAGLAALVVFSFSYLRDPGIVTQVGEQRMLTLEDGSRVYLNTDTRVAVRFDQRSRSVELKNGEALFEVAKHPRLPFFVVAGERTVQALGTTFVVRRDSEKLAVTLIEGRVSVTSPNLKRVFASSDPSSLPLDASHGAGREKNAAAAGVKVLLPGQRLTFVEQGVAQLDHPSVAKVTAWRQGQVALDDMALSDAVVEMNRYSAVKLVVAYPEAGRVRTGGFFRMGDSASFARAVAATYGFEVIERSDEIVIAGQPKAELK